MTTEQNSFKTTEISRPTKGDFEKTLKVNRRGQNHWMLKIDSILESNMEYKSRA